MIDEDDISEDEDDDHEEVTHHSFCLLDRILLLPIFEI